MLQTTLIKIKGKILLDILKVKTVYYEMLIISVTMEDSTDGVFSLSLTSNTQILRVILIIKS